MSGSDLTIETALLVEEWASGHRSATALAQLDLVSFGSLSHVLGAVRCHFRAEFLGRLDAVVTFKPLGPAEVEKIVELEIDKASRRAGLVRRGIAVSLSREARAPGRARLRRRAGRPPAQARDRGARGDAARRPPGRRSGLPRSRGPDRDRATRPRRPGDRRRRLAARRTAVSTIWFRPDGQSRTSADTKSPSEVTRLTLARVMLPAPNMYSYALPIAIVLAGCSAPRSDPSTPMPEDRLDALRVILANYEALVKAFAGQDAEAIIAMRTPDFSVDYPTGVRDSGFPAAESVRRFFVLNKPPITVSFAILAIDGMTGEQATLQIFQRSSRYQDLAGKLRRVDHDVTQRETWVRRPAGWRLHHVDQIRDRHRWIDGKAIDPERPFDPDAPPHVPSR